MTPKTQQRSTLFILFPILILLALIPSCKTIPKISPAPTPPPPKTLPPYTQDWIGTTWIIQQDPIPTFPGYQGFHLGTDNQLYPINLPNTTGGQWTHTKNTLTLNFISTTQKLPIPSTTYTAHLIGTNSTQPTTIQLTPQSPATPAPSPLILASPHIDIIENHWIPKKIKGSETLHWPKDTKIYFIILPGLSNTLDILGYGGENRFRASLKLGQYSFNTGPIALTRRYGPSSDFENLYIKTVSDSNRFIQVYNDLFLFNETTPLAAFRVKLFD